MNSQGKQSHFLATTALDEFWDTRQQIVFLGDWCLRYSRRAAWERLHGTIMPRPWEGVEKLHHAYRYVNEVYEKILPLLARALNSIHDVDRSNRYWRIVIGPWLFYYIHLMYDRNVSLCNAFAKYPDITTYGWTSNNHVVPKDMMEFHWLSRDDPYNLQVYTKIFDAMGKNIKKKDIQMPAIQLVSPVLLPRNSKKRALIHKIAKLFSTKNKTILYDPYFSRSVELKVYFATLGKVWPQIQMTIDAPLMQVNTQMRQGLRECFPASDSFTEILKHTLPMDIPQSQMEAFKHIGHEMESLYPVAPKAIYSAVSWYFDEPFKQWAALSAERGTKLMGIQHGGNYGSPRFMAVEDHETAITDKFYSWGWDRSGCFSRVIPMPATKLTARKTFSGRTEKQDILFVGTFIYRYLCRFQDFNNYHFSDYLLWQFRFVEGILPIVGNKLRLRIHKVDDGWEMRQRWQDRFPGLNIEDRYGSFWESLENCRLFVCDHLSTTFTEALSANKPTILFWDPTVNELRNEAKPSYEALRAVGILHHSPEDAVAAAKAIYEDIESWWTEPSRQAARKSFCDRFARVSDHAVKEWITEFQRMVFNHSYNQ